MNQLITLSKSDPNFIKYLMGTFSQSERALPVKSLNVATDTEVITFEIVPVSKVHTPNSIRKWAQILKLQNLLFILFPIFILLSENYIQGRKFDIVLSLFSLIGALLLALSFNLRNDVKDHKTGLDRIHSEGGSQAIQRGWTTADQLQKLSNILLYVGIIFGIPAVFVYSKLLILIGVVSVIGIIGVHSYNNGLKYRLWSEFTVFLLLGPMLAIGYQIALDGQIYLETLFIGIIFGWFSTFNIHLKNFSAIMTNNQIGFINSINFFGFEKSKKFLFYWWLILVILLNIYHLVWSTFAWSLFFIGISFFLSILFLNNLAKIKSPVSSFQKNFLEKTKVMIFLLTTVWVLEKMTYILLIDIN